MVRKRRFRFGLPTVFAGRPSVGGVGLGCQPIRFAAMARFGALGSGWPDSDLSESKSPQRIFRRRCQSAAINRHKTAVPPLPPRLGIR